MNEFTGNRGRSYQCILKYYSTMIPVVVRGGRSSGLTWFLTNEGLSIFMNSQPSETVRKIVSRA